MARYKLTLAYDGTDFLGSQRQAAGSSSPQGISRPRTVQGELEKALRKLGWDGRSTLLSGRTDTGVHAAGQVASVDLDWSHADDDLIRALNSNLPADMSVRSAEVVDDKFHPRFDALARTYRYRLFCQPIRDPLRERFAWRIPSGINTAALAEAGKQFIGTHDFNAFGSPTAPRGTTVRTVMKSRWMQIAEDEWQYEVKADAFLYRMVRRMVFVQAVVAQGKISAEAIARSLAKQVYPVFDRRASGRKRSEFPAGLAPAHGLTLVEVSYKESIGQ